MNPDMNKVAAAVAALEARQRANMPKIEAAVKARPMRELPLPPSPVAQDVAIRKPLKAHGIKCSGFFHGNFLNRD